MYVDDELEPDALSFCVRLAVVLLLMFLAAPVAAGGHAMPDPDAAHHFEMRAMIGTIGLASIGYAAHRGR